MTSDIVRVLHYKSGLVGPCSPEEDWTVRVVQTYRKGHVGPVSTVREER